MTHPLTDDIIHTMWGKGDPSQKFEYRLARASADWQLEQVIDWIRENLYWEEEDGSVRYVYGNGFASICTTEVIADLKKAMRPQEEDNQ